MALPLKSQSQPARDVYKDFDLSFTPHPLTGDIGVKADAGAVQQALRSLILTNFYERPFQPTIGSNVTKLLFEPVDPLTAQDLRQAIYEVVANYEPRVDLQDVVIEDNSSRNSYTITLIYTLAGLYDGQRATVVLQRLR